jgi:TonB family protein
MLHVCRPPSPFLGFQGASRRAPNLDPLQPNSLKFFFFQPAKQGTIAALGAGVLDGKGETGDKVLPAPDPARRPRRPTAKPAASGIRRADPTPEKAMRGNQGPASTPSPDELPLAEVGLESDVPYSENVAILHLVKPTYPEIELNRRISARVVVALHVTPDGEVDEFQVQEANADPPGPTRAFELAALDALRLWRFRLPHRSEYADGHWFTVPVEYSPQNPHFDGLESMTLPRTSQ